MRYLILAIAIVFSFIAGLLIGNIEIPSRLIKLANDIFSDSKTVAAIASAIFALLALLVQFAIGSKQAVIGARQAEAARISSEAARITALNAGDKAIATLRMQWVTDLRKTIAEYHSILMTSSADKMSEELLRRLSDLGTQLDLMLNTNDPAQQVLWQVLDDIYNLDEIKERQKMDRPLIMAGRTVMKEEWEKIKMEFRGKEFL